MGLSNIYAAEKLNIATSVKQVPLYVLPVLAAEDSGYWKQQGLDVKYIPFRSGSSMHRAVAAGSVDMGLATAVSVIQAASRRVPEVIVADLKARNPFSLWVPTASPIKSARDIKKARIAVTRLGGTLHAFGQAMAKILGLEKKIRFVGAGGIPEMMASLKAGNVEGMMGDIASVAPLKYEGAVRELISGPDYLPNRWVDLVVFSQKGLTKKKPKVVGAVIKAVLKGANLAGTNEAWAVNKMKSYLHYSQGVAKMIYPMIRYSSDGKIDVQGLNNVRTFLIEYGIIRKGRPPTLEKLYTKEFTG